MTKTKTEAKRLARKAREHGYYQPDGTHVWVECPLKCGERVVADLVTGAGSKMAQLDAFVIYHLEGCENG
jgi:hypothetical protein